MTRPNPLKLNPLQLKTLTLLQHLATLWGETPPDGSEGVDVNHFPHAHGDHLHVGDATVLSRDASGLTNESVWVALERKGLLRSAYPYSATLTPAGLAYETGIADQILHRADH
ncbi:MAG TPA: hypothetical protein VKS60_02570 [Stellaceae bacterium]|nr:hypothetical protein [Stellaceae bacterium]